MRLLGFDAGCARPSAALLVDGRVVAAAVLPADRTPAEGLVAMLAEVLAEGGVDWPELDGVAVATGPGGFTGIRVAVAAARAICLATGCPAMPVTYFEAVREQAGEAAAGRPVAVLKDLRRGEVMVQSFGADGRPAGEPELLTPEAARTWMAGWPHDLAGDGLSDVLAPGSFAPQVDDWPLGEAVARAALRKLKAGEPLLRGGDLHPFYGRPPDAHASGGRSLIAGAAA